MTYRLIQFICCFLFITCSYNGNAQKILIKNNYDFYDEYQLNSVKKITFVSGKLNVYNYSNSYDEYLLSSIKHIEFRSSTKIIETTAINEDKFLLYPNPFKDIIYFSSKDYKKINGNIDIYSLEGKKIQSIQIKDEIRLPISLPSLSKGLYLLKYTNDKEIITFKIIKN